MNKIKDCDFTDDEILILFDVTSLQLTIYKYTIQYQFGRGRSW